MIHKTPDGEADSDVTAVAAAEDAPSPDSDRWSRNASGPKPALEPRSEDDVDPAPATPGDVAVEAERLVREGIEQTARSIRRNPLLAVGVAAGAGLLLGALLGRKH